MQHEPSTTTRHLVREAADIARDWRHEQIEPEHLLLALLTVPESGTHDDAPPEMVKSLTAIRELLQRASLPEINGNGNGNGSESIVERLRAEVERQLPTGTEMIIRGKLVTSPKSQRVLEFADAEATHSGSESIAPMHLLTALSHEESGLTGRVLRQFGCTPEQLRQASAGLFESPRSSVSRRLETNADTALPLQRSRFDTDDDSSSSGVNGTQEGLVETLVDEAAGLTYRERTDDARLYVPRNEGWTANIKRGWEKDYCYLQNPGEEYFHLILSGELYLQRGDEKYCLNCALRHGIVTSDRLYWQRLKRRETQ